MARFDRFDPNAVLFVCTGAETTSQEVELNTELLYAITAGCERVLTRPKGCLWLLGRLGVGRNTAVRIAAARHNAAVVSPKTRPVYSRNAFRNDLKTVRAGIAK